MRDLEEFGNGGAVWQQQGWAAAGAGFSRCCFSSAISLMKWSNPQGKIAMDSNKRCHALQASLL